MIFIHGGGFNPCLGGSGYWLNKKSKIKYLLRLYKDDRNNDIYYRSYIIQVKDEKQMEL